MSAVAAAVAGAGFGLGLWLAVAGLRGHRVLPGLGTRPRRVLAGTGRSKRLWLSAGVGLAAWWVTGWFAAAVVVVLAALGLPRLFSDAGHRAQVSDAEAIARWTEMLRDAMAAADGVEEAIEATVPIAPEPIRSAVALLDAARRNRPLSDALAQFGGEVGHPSADLVVAALTLAAKGEGTNYTRVLDRLAAITRDEVRMRQRVEAGRARLRTSARLLVVILAVVVGVIALLFRSYLDPYSTAGGQVVLMIVVAMFATGAVLLDRMSRVQAPQRFTPRRRVVTP